MAEHHDDAGWSDYWGRAEVVKRHAFRNNAYRDVVETLVEKTSAESLCLEIGCGSGTYAIELLVKGRRSIGADQSAEALQLTRLKSQHLYGASIPLVRADLFTMPFPDNTFDLIFSDGVIEHLDIQAALRAMFLKLKPGGWLITKVPSGNILYRLVYYALSSRENRPFEAWYPPSKWCQFAADAGLDNVHIGTCGGILIGTYKRLLGNGFATGYLPNVGRLHYIFFGRKPDP